jgi:hypothetical protein
MSENQKFEEWVILFLPLFCENIFTRANNSHVETVKIINEQ